MDEKYRSALDKILRLAKQNTEFDAALRRAFSTPSTEKSVPSANIANDVRAIREALDIRANVSIDYSFVTSQRLRDQLIVDNLRMENAALNHAQKEDERFYSFCVNAFYQMESIVNYYWYKSFPKFDDLAKVLEATTASEMKDFQFHLEGQTNIGEIKIAAKLNACCNTLFPYDLNFKRTCSQLRQARNEGEHRCKALLSDPDKQGSALFKFFQYNTYDSIRALLKKMVSGVEKALAQKCGLRLVKAEIVNNFPGGCFIKYDGKSEQLGNQFLKNVKNLKQGDQIALKIINQMIIEVIPSTE